MATTGTSTPRDVEKDGEYAHLTNSSIRSFGWEGVTVTVKDRTTKEPKEILSSINGMIKAGEMLAIMGPSGCGKTTLLNVLAHRTATHGATVESSLFINGTKTTLKDFRKFSSYVEQDDALIGALTVRETLYFAAKLALPSTVTKTERMQRIEALIAAFGLKNQSNTLIGTPIQKGISGGQKRRVSVASQLITSPKILFLDEPSSGLDSAAAFEVMSFVKNIAAKYKIIVIASIHQPSTSIFEMFDRLLLLSKGKVAYNGRVTHVQSYFENIGHKIPLYTNPAEHIIDLVNTDFSGGQDDVDTKLESIHKSWAESTDASAVTKSIEEETGVASADTLEEHGSTNPVMTPFVLAHRSLIKSYRDIIPYGIRIAMYLGLAILVSTVFLRLSPTQENIRSFANEQWYSGAFMSFMACAYIPSYLEDRDMYIKERANGLYGPFAFMVSNFIVGTPFLFIITFLFSVIVYWLSNFRPSASGFWYFIMWLFLDLLAAESLVVFLSSLIPIFVVALALVAFANGLWMAVGGHLLSVLELNPFWKYVFHYIDYQAYVFQGMMVNEFASRTYDCGSDCHCMYVTPLQDQCKIDGRGVLDSFGISEGNTGKWVGILLAITAVYRILSYLILKLQRA